MIFPTDEPFPPVWEERGLRKPPNLTSTESARRAAESASSITHITWEREPARHCFFFFFSFHHSGRSIVVIRSSRSRQPTQCVILLAGVHLNYNNLVTERRCSLITRPLWDLMIKWQKVKLFLWESIGYFCTLLKIDIQKKKKKKSSTRILAYEPFKGVHQ